MQFNLKLISSLVAVPTLFSASCATPEFDEKAYHAEIAQQKVSDLYASHVEEGEFFNPWKRRVGKGFFDFLKVIGSNEREYTEEEENYKPVKKPGAVDIVKKAGNRDFIIWLGHATFLFRLKGEYFLTDPYLDGRLALLFGRESEVGLTLDEIKTLTKGKRLNVVISHNHYDHLNTDNIEDLPPATLYLPLETHRDVEGSADHHKIVELDWWKSAKSQHAKVTFLPAQHWCKRANSSTNTVLWGSWMIESNGKKVYFAGDSGYFSGYKEIGRKFKNIDIALMPITAYHPRWFMYYAHMNVEEAIMSFKDLKAKTFIPTQWGTFGLGKNPAGLGALELKELTKNEPKGRYLIPMPGEVVFL